MKTKILSLLALLILGSGTTVFANDEGHYSPSPENIKSRIEFNNDRFGIFIHWGIYSMFGQGEWYLNYGPKTEEYSKAASAFYPHKFDASQWAKAIKSSGARYICFTTRHHDGFSMFHTGESDYNIVDATPYGKDVLKELSEACKDEGLKLHLYYSHLDWMRNDYPLGRTGHTTRSEPLEPDWENYYGFMNRQLTELLTNYGDIRAIWFDGWWDHDQDSIPFNWELPAQYAMIHNLQPSCLVGNNHHQNTFEGEDIQIFERDVPGENFAGYSEQDISELPLETCQTMNGMWGYKVVDTDYKSDTTLIRLLVKTAGQGANLLLNIGPQPNGELPALALDRLEKIGKWLDVYGETIYSTGGAPFAPQPWGTATTSNDKVFLHVINAETADIEVPLSKKVKSVKDFITKEDLKFSKGENGLTLHLSDVPSQIDYVVEIITGEEV